MHSAACGGLEKTRMHEPMTPDIVLRGEMQDFALCCSVAFVRLRFAHVLRRRRWCVSIALHHHTRSHTCDRLGVSLDSVQFTLTRLQTTLETNIRTLEIHCTALQQQVAPQYKYALTMLIHCLLHECDSGAPISKLAYQKQLINTQEEVSGCDWM